VVRAGDNDGDGVAIVGGLVLGGTAAVRDDAGNDAVLAFASVADIPRAKVLPGEFSARGLSPLALRRSVIARSER